MSNKLKKQSPGFEDVRKDLRERILKEGGLNVIPELMYEYTKVEDKDKVITEDEFYDILARLSDEGFRLYKISQISKGRETRGIMICDSNTIVAFAKNPENTEEAT